MRVTIAQLNPIVGDLKGNLDKLKNAVQIAYNNNSDLIVFSELFITGYPPKDLLEKPCFIKDALNILNEVIEFSSNYPNLGILVGTPFPSENIGKGLYNSAVLIYNGKILFTQSKFLLPNYDVFDEERYFDSAKESNTVRFKDQILGISICEDAWNELSLWPYKTKYNYTIKDNKIILESLEPISIYKNDPIVNLVNNGATLLINISASPYYLGKKDLRYKIISSHSKRYKLPFIYVNQVGANDELIFDGSSMVLNQKGEVIFYANSFKEHIETIDLKSNTQFNYTSEDILSCLHDALVIGIKDYMYKLGFKKAVIGLSGGIDSALTCYLAVQAIGNSNVLGIAMPSPYSSTHSIEDAQKLANNLNIEFKIIPINNIYNSYLSTLEPFFKGYEFDITEENIQSRIRGNILMAFSNKFGHLVLSTGNKSELSVGYCTLYGDMAGGLNVLGDVPKTLIYELANYINRECEIIPYNTINKPPSAELKPNQVDQDTLPPYPVLDKLINYYIEENLSLDEITKKEITDIETVKWVISTINKSEYKRKQAPLVLKVTSKAFGSGRRMPIVNKYRD